MPPPSARSQQPLSRRARAASVVTPPVPPVPARLCLAPGGPDLPGAQHALSASGLLAGDRSHLGAVEVDPGRASSQGKLIVPIGRIAPNSGVELARRHRAGQSRHDVVANADLERHALAPREGKTAWPPLGEQGEQGGVFVVTSLHWDSPCFGYRAAAKARACRRSRPDRRAPLRSAQVRALCCGVCPASGADASLAWSSAWEAFPAPTKPPSHRGAPRRA